MPRVPARLKVTVQARGQGWLAETADFGPGGCLLVTPKPLAEGSPVRLAIDCSGVDPVLSVLGMVAWSGSASQARAGVTFAGNPRNQPGAVSPNAWFDMVVASLPGMASYRSSAPEKLALNAPLFLLPPPRSLPDLSADEMDLLSRAENGMTARQVMELRPGREPATCRALFGLFAKKALTLALGQSSPAWRWREALGRMADGTASALPAAAAPAPRPLPAPVLEKGQLEAWPAVPPVLSRVSLPLAASAAAGQLAPSVAAGQPSQPARSKNAQECFDRACEAADLGQVHMAIGLMRRALLLAPRDPEIAALLGKLAFRGRQV